MATQHARRSLRPVGFMLGTALVVTVFLLGALVLVNFGRRTDRARTRTAAAIEQLSLLRGLERTGRSEPAGADGPAWARLRVLVAGTPDTTLVDSLHLLRETEERTRAAGAVPDPGVQSALASGLETLEMRAGDRLFGASDSYFDALWSDRRIGFGLIVAGLLGALGMALSLRGAASRYRRQNAEFLAEIHERRRVEMVAAEREEKLRTILEAEPECVKLLDHSGQVLEMNRAGLDMVEADQLEQIRGRPVLDLLVPEHRAAFAAMHQRVMAGGREALEFEVVGLRGTRRWLATRAVPLRDNRGDVIAHLGVTRDVTERRRVLQALEGEVSRNQVLLNSILDGYLLMDEDRWILDVNPAACMMLGYSREELLRMSLGDLGVVPEDVEAAADALERFRRHRLQTVLTAKDGRQIRIDVSAVEMGAAPDRRYALFARDLTPLLSVTEALRTSESRLQAVLEVSNDGVWEWEIPTGRVRYSPRWIQSLGYRADEVPEDVSFWEQLIHPEDMPRVQQALANHFAGRTTTYRVENRLRTASGSYRWNLDQGRVVEWDAHGRPLRMVGADTDISERKAAEDEIRSLNADLEHRVAERTAALEAAIHELEAFAYSVSHDLRGPLRAIDGFSHVLEEEAATRLEEGDRRLLARIRGGVATMGLLLDELLILSRVTRADLTPELVDLSAMAADVLADLRLSEGAARARVEIEPGIRVTADPGLLRIVLHNLLDNALKFSGDREQPVIRVGAKQSGSGTAVFVSDNGAGFDPAHRDKLFRPFHRLHSPREFPGSGIGLATVERIIKRHGGRVWAESLPGRGATFHFTLGFPATPALRRADLEAARAGAASEGRF